MTPTDPITSARAARTRRRWPKLVALLLLPTAVAALLLVGLGRPVERLDTVPAAIVNRDEPVKIDGRLAPLGRQLAQAIAHPAGDPDTYDWVVTNMADAEAGLAGGDYAAVVVIPRGFSRAATSLASDKPRQATIAVRSGDRSGLTNAVITQTLTRAAQQAFGADLTERYLRQVYVGFGDLRTGLGRVSSGADQLTDGTVGLADGIGQLSEGLDRFAAGTDSLASGTGSLADGVSQLDAGVGEAAAGAARLATGHRKLADGTAELSDGAEQLAAALGDAGDMAADADVRTRDALVALGGLAEARQVCQQRPAECAAALQRALADLPTQEDLVALATATATTNAYLNGAQGRAGLVSGAADLAQGAERLAAGSAQAAGGTEQLARGLRRLDGGTGELTAGAGQLADGTGQLNEGAARAAAGADPLAAGAESLSQGTGELAAGLHRMADGVPSYSKARRGAMAHVAATPVVSHDAGQAGLTWLAAALLVTLSLWVGGTLTWLVLKPVSARAYGSSLSAGRLSWQAARPGLIVGAAQGLLVGGIVAASLGAPTPARAAFVIVSVLAGAAFAAALQGVMALFGLVGGVVAVAWGAVALAAGLVATVPSWFGNALTQLPLGPLVTGLRQLASGAGGLPWGTVVGLAVVGLCGFLATMAATRRRALLPRAGRE